MKSLNAYGYHEKDLSRQLSEEIDDSGDVRDLITELGIGLKEGEYPYDAYNEILEAKVAEEALAHEDAPWLGEHKMVAGELHLFNFIGSLDNFRRLSLTDLNGVCSPEGEAHPLASPFTAKDLHSVAARLVSLSLSHVEGQLWEDFCSAAKGLNSLELDYRPLPSSVIPLRPLRHLTFRMGDYSVGEIIAASCKSLETLKINCHRKVWSPTTSYADRLPVNLLSQGVSFPYLSRLQIEI